MPQGKVPPISDVTLRFFTRIVRSYFRRHFRAVLIQNAKTLQEVKGPLIVYANHASWWDPMVSVNLTAAFELAREASKFMIEQRSGKIINIASLFSFLGGQGSPAYAATKAGLVGFTKAYCDELATHNIQVNAIAPGYLKTAITEATRADPAADRRIVEHIPAARWGETADLMGAAVFLASRAADYVNGHVLVVDGGYLVR